MLTVQVENPEGLASGNFQVTIVCDEDGFTELKRQIGFLEGKTDHVHLRTESWGGVGLDAEGYEEKNLLVNQLTIYKVAK